MKSHSLRLLALLVALVCLSSPVQASSIYWYSGVYEESNPLPDNYGLYTSTGTFLDSSFSFELGSFANGFIPTYGNVDQWAANWKVFDRLFSPDENGWNADVQFFVGSVHYNTDGSTTYTVDNSLAHTFAQGEQLYLWVYNSKDIVAGSEWALLTDAATQSEPGWTVPDPAAHNDEESLDPSFDWRLMDANAAVMGGANGVQGDGTYSVTPALFSLQTAVVPEPGSAFLLLAAAAAHLARRSRRATRMHML